MSSPDGAVAAAQDLNETLQALERRLGEALRREKVTRRLAVGLAVSVLVDIVVTAIVTVSLIRSDAAAAQGRRNEATISQIHAAAVGACQQGNQTRAQQVQLWEHIYSLGVTAKTPPAERAADNQLIGYVRHVFAPRDCAAVYRLHPASARSTVDDHRPA